MTDERSALKITPVIEGGHVITVEVNGEPLPLKAPIPISDLGNFIEKLEEVAKYIDFSGESGWTDDDLEYFFIFITDRARNFFKILSTEGDWIIRDKILSILKVGGRQLAGTLSSPGQYFTYNRKEPLYEKELISSEDESQTYAYRIKPKYLESVREALKMF